MTRISTDASDHSPSLSAVGLLEFLRCDARPTFILETGVDIDDNSSTSQLVFVNDALKSDSVLLESIETLLDNADIETSTDAEARVFQSWLRLNPPQKSASFHGLLWSLTHLRQRWSIVSGLDNVDPHHDDQYAKYPASNHYSNEARETVLETKSTVPESSRYQRHESLEKLHPRTLSHDPSVLAKALGVKPSPHNFLVLGFDWAKTPLGPIEAWPPVLRHLVPCVLNGLQPGIMTWGPERTLVYNEAYVSLIKGLHPGALGSSAMVAFGAFWDAKLEQEWRTVELHGAVRYENSQIFMDRSGFLEETYFTYSLTPLLDADGHCCGVDNRCFEMTRQTVVEARMLSLLKISESATSVTSLDDFWQCLTGAMASNASDFPLFAIYSLRDSDLISNTIAIESDLITGRTSLVLRGSAGFPPDHSSIPDILEGDSDMGFAPAFDAVLRNSTPLLLNEGNKMLKPNLLHGCFTPGLQIECNQIVVCPLHSSSRKVMGFLALGINPHRPYDDEYKIFVRLLSRQIETQLSPILSLVKERIAAQLNAERSEYEQMLLTTQLEQQTLEARRSELRFLRFAEQAPIGVYVLGSDGGVKFANEAWYQLTGITADYDGTHGWRLNVHPDDIERVDEQWQRLLEGHTQTNFEWKAIRKRFDTDDEVMYLRASSFPELAADGKMTTVTGVLMDLSLERAQQRSQNERLKDALEAKRSQEYFMDMVSHEIRNPLHAVLQLAEETSSLLKDIRPSASQAHTDSFIQGCVENIHTIIYCGHHQKQILDDVLTLSKLNSDMLTLSLTDTAPATVVSKVLKFFDSDIRLSNIDVSINTSGEKPTHQYPNVLMDSGRVLQVLFNLVGNSIKFMKDRPIRKLTVTVRMTPNMPEDGHLRYLPSGKKYADPTSDMASATSRAVYVCYSVEDTGPGLSTQEMNVLFERFKQVSPKTHTQYGGSGLGLFISRELAERHGGKIGLASVVKHGSTFAFYVKCLISEPEPVTIDGDHGNVTTLRNPLTTAKRAIASPDSPANLPLRRLSLSRTNTTILIVEDNIVNQKILDRQLKKLGYQTRITGNGLEALSILKESTWWHEPTVECFNLSIILCDLEMPVMDGMTCVRTIREWQQNNVLDSNIPVVALTGNARAEQIKAAKEAGFDDVVSKPYSMQVLVSLIDKMVLGE